jgi:hypothetical protein
VLGSCVVLACCCLVGVRLAMRRIGIESMRATFRPAQPDELKLRYGKSDPQNGLGGRRRRRVAITQRREHTPNLQEAPRPLSVPVTALIWVNRLRHLAVTKTQPERAQRSVPDITRIGGSDADRASDGCMISPRDLVTSSDSGRPASCVGTGSLRVFRTLNSGTSAQRPPTAHSLSTRSNSPGKLCDASVLSKLSFRNTCDSESQTSSMSVSSMSNVSVCDVPMI